MPVGIDPKVDYAFKYVFGREANTAALIGLLHAVLNPPPNEQIAEVELLNPFTEKASAEEKLAVLDIKARDQSGRQYNVEMQMLGYASLPQRALFYWSKLYSQQITRGDRYDRLRPTIAICFVNSVLFPGVPGHHACFRLMEVNYGVVLTDDIQIHVVELPKFGTPADKLATPLDAWLYFLRHAAELEVQMLPNALDTPEIRQALASLAMLAETGSEREIYEGRLKALRDEHARLSDTRTKALAEGLARGKLIGRITTAQRFLGQDASPEDALEAMGTEELERLAEELERQAPR